METQATEAGLPSLSAHERRRYPRTLSHVDAVVRTRNGCGRYLVSNLSVCGALITQGPPLELDTIAEIDLHIPEHPQIRVVARVAREGVLDDGERYMGLEFLHSSDETEDMIQAALLDEIERSQTHGVIPSLD
ncbi:PilZ domain-containing protein [Paraliomyxa miuraensis]|uniref:PilZ domain-containing protein n=1 Tax=Paraliomyxa miuraensis TaxID=376150 RepID=UPI00225C0BCD|nr:PilZ domain-containing protein [Paraliomyxa miuraensis]MCX4242257.1 PilZ domain-containing protein [Paraliomyxa miuraensis]